MKDNNGDWLKERILKGHFEDLYNIDTCVALMGFGEATISEESQLEELRLR